MADSRSIILEKVRHARGLLPDLARPVPAKRPQSEPVDVLLKRFVAAAEFVDAEVIVEATREAACAKLLELSKGESILSWDLDMLPQGLPAPADQPLRATLGITGCEVAIAATGSLVMIAGKGKPRLASLSVRTHVALLDPSQLVPDLATAMERLSAQEGSLAHVNIITGPSRSADIEMTLTKGVHGPKRLVILVAPWK